MRRNQPPEVKPAYPQYRVRFMTSVGFDGQEPRPVTAHPGIIKRNRPKAEKILAAYSARTPDMWLEIQEEPDGEWKKL